MDAITHAIGADKRISPYYFRGGLSFGGTCFPRDVRAFLTMANKYGIPDDIMQAVSHINRYQDEHLSEIILRELDNNDRDGRIGILGLSFTVNTPVITELPSIKLIHELIKHARHVIVFDPLALENTRVVFGDAIEYASSAEECLEKVDICVVANRDKEYKHAVEAYLPCNPLIVIDCWRMIDPSCIDDHIKLIPLGKYSTGNQDEIQKARMSLGEIASRL